MDRTGADPEPARRSGKRAARGPVLSSRLRMVADLLPDGGRLIDVGSDHAYLPIRVVLDGRARIAVAADIRPGPLVSAQRNITRFGCAGRVQTELSDGLRHFRPEAGDRVVMAGLGGLEMIDILRAAPAIWPVLVLQPQKSAPELRRYLADSGYVIRREALCLDGGRLYLALLAEHAPAEAAAAPLEPADCFIGPALRREPPPLFSAYLLRQRKLVTHALRRQPLLLAVRETIDRLLAATPAAPAAAAESDPAPTL